MTILVVEDEPKISSLMRKGLVMKKYEVEMAYDGEEALRLAETRPYSVIIMDIMLPKMTGVEVTKSLRKKGISTPILMLTARDTIEERAKGFEAGANDYLLKPFSFKELLARLKGLSERRET